MFYFYCPRCEKEDVVFTLPRGTVGNCRDGYGKPLHHYECPQCHNLDAAYVSINPDDEDTKEYFKYVIGMYQGIRTHKEELNK